MRPATLGQLHVAACNGWLEALNLLLQNGASVNVQDGEGNTPMHLAIFFMQASQTPSHPF